MRDQGTGNREPLMTAKAVTNNVRTLKRPRFFDFVAIATSLRMTNVDIIVSC